MIKLEVIERINAIMAAKAGIDPSEIKPEDFYDELGAGSIQCIEALLEIEKEFGIDIPSSMLHNVATMQDVYDLVHMIVLGLMD